MIVGERRAEGRVLKSKVMLHRVRERWNKREKVVMWFSDENSHRNETETLIGLRIRVREGLQRSSSLLHQLRSESPATAGSQFEPPGEY